MIEYLCGCKDPIVLNDDLVFLKQYFTFDSQGFIICQAHRLRRKGWRSVPYTATTTPFYGMGLWTEFQYEQYLVFGIVPKGAKKNEMRAA